MAEIYEIDLCSYRDCLDDTRLMISEVVANNIVHPFDISTDVGELADNVLAHERGQSLAARAQRAVSERLRAAKGYSTGYPFVASAKLRGTHVALIIRNSEDDLKPGSVIVQSNNLFDLIKGHPSNSGILDHLIKYLDAVFKIANSIQDRFMSLTSSGVNARKRFSIVLAGVHNPHTWYSPLSEVAAPGFLIHSLKINAQWQNLSDYSANITIKRPINIIAVSNIHFAPWLFLNSEGGGQRFLASAKEEVQKLKERDRMYNAVSGLVLTPLPDSGLPNDPKFWLKIRADEDSCWDLWREHARSMRRYAKERRDYEAPRHERLRVEAQAFAERFCTGGRLQKAWDTAERSLAVGDERDRRVIALFMAELHSLEHEDFDQEDWADVDWTKAYPRIDRIAKAWALSKIQAVRSEASTSNDHGWVDVGDEDIALENTLDLRDDLFERQT